MKKITLSDDEIDSLSVNSQQGSKGYTVQKKIFKEVLADLDSVTNIDPKGNVGLQTCARQLAHEYLLEIYELIFPDDAMKKNNQVRTPGGKVISQFR